MKVKVIGSGSMFNEYNSACYLVDDDIMVDFPNGACKYLYRFDISPTSINNVLITHFHEDHYFDLPIYFINKFKKDSKNVNMYCSKEGRRKIKKVGKLAFPDSFPKIYKGLDCNYNFKDKFMLNDYNVDRVLVNHGKILAHGYIFEKDNIKFGFTGDTTICDGVEYMASICNYLFCDAMFPKVTEKHMGIDVIKELSSKYKNCKFIVSHLNNDTREEFKKLKIKNVIVPEDGMEIEME